MSFPVLDPPFVTVEGVINIRSIGGYPTSNDGAIVKPGQVFRSGEMNHITDVGKRQLQDLGIKVVFDYRGTQEITMYNPISPEIEGVKVVRPPSILSTESFAPENIVALLKRYDEKELETFVEEYSNNLRNAGPAYRPVFEHLRDNPDEPCLFHCTAGKDRTGMLAALILMLLGVDDDTIAEDYALTTMGLVPFSEQLTQRFLKVDVFRDNWSGFLKMGSSKKESMEAWLPVIRTTFGGAEGYVREYIGLNDDDVAKIRHNLLVKS